MPQDPEKTQPRVITRLDDLSDAERQAALRMASAEARQDRLDAGLMGKVSGGPDVRADLGADVVGKVGHPHHLSRIEIQALGGPYDPITRHAQTGRDRYGLSDAQLIGAVSAPTSSLRESRIQGMGLDQKPGARAAKAAFMRRMRRMSMLNSLEAARLPDAAIAMQLAAEVAAQPDHAKKGHASAGIADLTGPEGALAPQTPVGAASVADNEGKAAKRRRVGQIANWLMHQIQADLVIGNGFAVGPLIDAMSRVVRSRGKIGADHLKALLMQFLKSRQG